MTSLREWAERYWDVLAMLAALAAVLVVSLGLGVAYNVAATRLERSTLPPAVDPGARSSAAPDDTPAPGLTAPAS
jgi:hypothetical protein